MYRMVAVSPQRSWSEQLKEVAIAGAVAGGGAQLGLFPMEAVMKRVQVDREGYREAIRHVCQNRVGFEGLKAPLLAAMMRRLITFFPMEAGRLGAESLQLSSFWGGVCGSAVGGAVESMVTTVSERHKMLKQAQGEIPPMYPVTADRIRYWYRGMLPNTLKNVTANPVLFAMSPRLKQYFPDWMPAELSSFAAAFGSSFVVQLWGAPLDSCRALMQTPNKQFPEYNSAGTLETLRLMHRHWGFSGLFKGYLGRSVKVGAMGGVTMAIYPRILKWVGGD
jgi:hypothetical protein